MKLVAAIWRPNCFLIRHNSPGLSIVRIIYYGSDVRIACENEPRSYTCEDILRDEFKHDFVQTVLLEGEELHFAWLNDS
jgi:hypothetical protein